VGQLQPRRDTVIVLDQLVTATTISLAARRTIGLFVPRDRSEPLQRCESVLARLKSTLGLGV